MTASSLPSTNRRISAEEIEREQAAWDPGDQERVPAQASGKRRISPTSLSRTSQCLLRGLWAAQGLPGIGPSPFTQATFADGKAFEKTLLEKKTKKIWIRALNLELETNFSDGLPLIKGKELKVQSKESASAFAKCAAEALEVAAKAGSAPFAIHEPTLACDESGVALSGRPDLLIWTGAKWILADFKCSEEARRSHGIQIAAYARMLRAMRPDEAIAPRGVVIHCAAGYRYTADSSEADQATTLAHTLATAFPIASLDPVVAEFISFLSDTDRKSETLALAEAVFSSVCNECEFRYRCYPRFLESRHVSLLPLMKSELEAVAEAGITSIDDLVAAIDAGEGNAYDTLLELKENSTTQLRFLRKKAQKVLDCGLYSAWRANPAATAEPLFFVSTGKDFHFEPEMTADSRPTCLVVYSEGERRRAWAKMISLRTDWNIPTFVLSKEIQQTLHGPIPSLTLLPLAAMLRWAERDRTLTEFQKWLLENYPLDPKKFEQALQESPNTAQRLTQLQTVWNYLQSAAIPFKLIEQAE